MKLGNNKNTLNKHISHDISVFPNNDCANVLASVAIASLLEKLINWNSGTITLLSIEKLINTSTQQVTERMKKVVPIAILTIEGSFKDK